MVIRHTLHILPCHNIVRFIISRKNFDLDCCRLQRLESLYNGVALELEHLRARGNSIVTWTPQMDYKVTHLRQVGEDLKAELARLQSEMVLGATKLSREVMKEAADAAHFEADQVCASINSYATQSSICFTCRYAYLFAQQAVSFVTCQLCPLGCSTNSED